MFDIFLFTFRDIFHILKINNAVVHYIIVISITIFTSYIGIRDAWGGKKAHVLLSRMGPYKIFYWDILRTAPNGELESEVSLIE